jgi:Cu2+-exporting ATPase
MLREQDLTAPDRLDEKTKAWRDRGAAVVHVIDEGSVIGAIALEDAIRDEARSAVSSLRTLGVDVALITGDAEQVARAVAEDLGIERVLFEVLPEHKHREVVALQDAGHRVAMVGDGVNDAPALAQADVGIAIGAGTDVAIESAGVVLASDDPRAVVAVRRLSHASYVKMIQNLVWATGYNVVAIPLAAGAFAWAGLTLAPAIGAMLMSLSTIIVATNAQLLRRVDLGASQ